VLREFPSKILNNLIRSTLDETTKTAKRCPILTLPIFNLFYIYLSIGASSLCNKIENLNETEIFIDGTIEKEPSPFVKPLNHSKKSVSEISLLKTILEMGIVLPSGWLIFSWDSELKSLLYRTRFSATNSSNNLFGT
jgi:hypothetical protein